MHILSPGDIFIFNIWTLLFIESLFEMHFLVPLARQ